MADETENMTDEDKLLAKHRQERKQLQVEITKLKHSVPKGDKKKKKDVQAQIAQMEAELDERQQKEIDALHAGDAPGDDVCDAMKDLSTDDAKGSLAACAAAAAGEDDAGDAGAGKKMSKAQRRREKKEQQMRDRENEIREQEIQNLTGSRHVEAQRLKQLLKERNVAIFDIPSDGDCLYAAIGHQLRTMDIEMSVSELRSQTASYMRSHPDDFMPFLCKPDTGDPYTPEEYAAYCDELEQQPVWGGQLEIQALSRVLNRRIEVMQADSPVITSGEEFSQPSIILTYHRHAYGLGEHYNSVQPRPADEDDDEFS